jgi:YD repeat-containing protein
MGKTSPPPWERLSSSLTPRAEIAATFPNHRTSVSDFAWNPKNFSEIATVCGGGAQMWRIGEAEPYARFDWGASLLVVWSPDARWLATGDQTPSVHLYDFTRDYPLHIHGFETKVKAMDFSPTGSVCDGRRVDCHCLELHGKSRPRKYDPEQPEISSGRRRNLACSPNGEFLASGDNAGRLVISDAKGRPVSAFEGRRPITALAWSADGRSLAVGDAAGRVVLFSD